MSASEKKRAVRNGSNANVEDIYKQILGGNDICVDYPASLSSPGDNVNDEMAGNGPKTLKGKQCRGT